MVVLFLFGFAIGLLVMFTAGLLGLYLAAEFLIMTLGFLGCALFLGLITVFVVFILIPYCVWGDIKYKELKEKLKK